MSTTSMCVFSTSGSGYSTPSRHAVLHIAVNYISGRRSGTAFAHSTICPDDPWPCSARSRSPVGSRWPQVPPSLFLPTIHRD